MFDRFIIIGAYWIVATRHHSGQWSKGYAILSRIASMRYRIGRYAYNRGSDERNAAAQLLWKRRHEIRMEW